MPPPSGATLCFLGIVSPEVAECRHSTGHARLATLPGRVGRLKSCRTLLNRNLLAVNEASAPVNGGGTLIGSGAKLTIRVFSVICTVSYGYASYPATPNLARRWGRDPRNPARSRAGAGCLVSSAHILVREYALLAQSIQGPMPCSAHQTRRTRYLFRCARPRADSSA